MVDPVIEGVGEIHDVACYLSYNGSREEVTPLEGFDRVMDQYFDLVELNGDGPLDYHARDYGPYSSGYRSKSLSEDQKELLENTIDRQENWDLVFEVETDTKTRHYEPDWQDWLDREDISHEWERKPPSSLKLIGDSPDLRMRIARDYDEDLIHRVEAHHDIRVLQPGDITTDSSGWLQEIPLYIAHDGQEGMRDTVIANSPGLTPLVMDDLAMVDFNRDPEYEKSNIEAAFLYRSKPGIVDTFSGEAAESVAELYQTASLAGLSLADLESHELVHDVDGIRPVEHEIVMYNGSRNHGSMKNMFFDMMHTGVENGSREERDNWADIAQRRASEILEEEGQFKEFIPEYLEDIGSIDEDLVLDSKKIKSI